MSIEIKLNGETRQVDDGCTLQDLISSLQLPNRALAVARSTVRSYRARHGRNAFCSRPIRWNWCVRSAGAERVFNELRAAKLLTGFAGLLKPEKGRTMNKQDQGLLIAGKTYQFASPGG